MADSTGETPNSRTGVGSATSRHFPLFLSHCVCVCVCVWRVEGDGGGSRLVQYYVQGYFNMYVQIH